MLDSSRQILCTLLFTVWKNLLHSLVTYLLTCMPLGWEVILGREHFPSTIIVPIVSLGTEQEINNYLLNECISTHKRSVELKFPD